MKRVLKWLGIVALGLVAVVVVIALVSNLMARSRLGRTYQVTPEQVVVAADAASVERGKNLALGRAGCADCHMQDLAGGPMIDEPIMARLAAANLTPGKGGIGGSYTDADWVRAIRHGVKADGHPVFVMPSQDFYYLSDQDLGDIIAYLKTLPPVDRETNGLSLGPLGAVLFVTGQFPPLPADIIDHTAPRPTAAQRGVTTEYGQYLAMTSGCMACHGASLSGAPSQSGSSPDSPSSAPNLTPGGELRTWSEADFLKALKTGMTPNGRQLSTDMPWKAFSRMADDDLRALYAYVHSLPAKEYNQP